MSRPWMTLLAVLVVASLSERSLASEESDKDPGARGDARRGQPARMLKQWDKNGDGKIAKDEANEQLKPFFDQQDQNKDGFIDAEEAQAIADFVNSQQPE